MAYFFHDGLPRKFLFTFPNMDAPDIYDLFDFDSISRLLPQSDVFPAAPENTPSDLHLSSLAHVANVDEPLPADVDSLIFISTQDVVVPTPRQRRYAPRSRRGCLTCRARRKRCDAQQPTCRTCIRINALCQWPEKLRISDYGGEAEFAREKDSGSVSQSNVASVPTRVNNIDTSLVAAAPPMLTGATYGGVPSSIPPRPRYGRQPNLADASLQRHLLTYYIHTFIPRVTVVQSTANFFTSLYIPMAFHHTAVFDAIIACAAAHLAESVQQAEKAQELNLVVVKHHKWALDFIKVPLHQPELSDWENSKLEISVALLLLIGLQSQRGDRSLRWMQQINCVRQLLQQHKESAAAAQTSWETDCVQRHFSYHDVMSLIMEGSLQPETRTDLIAGSGPFAPCTLIRLAPQPQGFCHTIGIGVSSAFLQSQKRAQDVDCLLGLSEDLFSIIIRLRDLPNPNSFLGDIEESEFLKFETEISNWQYSYELASKLDLNARLDLIALAECHRLSALILLYRQFPSRSFFLSDLASQIMSIVPRIAAGSPVTPALTPILFLAGAELVTESEIAMCAARLESIRETMKMMNIASAEEVLRIVWKERLQNKNRADWLEILRARQWTINLG